MKRLSYLLLCLPLLGFSQEPQEIDPIAIALIDKMGAVIGSLEACSFDLETADGFEVVQAPVGATVSEIPDTAQKAEVREHL
ncbi:MAG: hypothetical protein P8Z38_05925 [Robiginitalea sp.]